MIFKTASKAFGRKKYLAAAIPLIMAAQAQGFEFFMGDMEGSLDSQISMGSSWRTEKQDAGLTTGIVGTATNSANTNDGDQNFKDGDAFSQIFKGSHDLQVSYGNYGAFVRGKYWYDAALEGKSDIDGNDLDDSGYHDLAKFSGAEVLDAFVYGEFEVLDMPLDVRVGKQVVSWGEGTFIRGGVNQINPIDVSSFRRPGAEIKEGLIPVNMVYTSLGLSESLSAEAFYQLDYKETVTAGCGTFFSTNDYQPDGCNTVKTAAGTISRNADGNRRPDSDGQFGVAFRYFSEALDTEFGFYAMNIHERSPLISGTKASFNENALYNGGFLTASITGLSNQIIAGNDLLKSSGINNYAELEGTIAALTGVTGQEVTLATLQGAKSSIDQGAAVGVMAGLSSNASNGTPLDSLIDPQTYFVEYPEDQQLAGVSFATNLGTLAVSGEVTHKLDVPFQINSTRLIGAALQAEGLYTYELATNGGNVENARAVVKAAHTSYGLEVIDTADGTAAPGFKTFDVTQAQVTAIKLVDQVLGASRFAIIGEAGYTYVHEFNSDIEFDGSGAAMEDRVTESSWGYRARIVGQYNDVFAGVNLSPVLAISHDVDGVSPAPGGNFIEGEKVLGLTLNAEYQNTYTAAVSYTQYSGGITNAVADRDFASISVGIQF
jgi:hypothetical protein